ncbi:MAG: hypothetical protein D6731_12290 [Planctomycetota bacterium]|nr:MAG: hypothetical protein D6731_12290 [Planctomycetota bacterium]
MSEQRPSDPSLLERLAALWRRAAPSNADFAGCVAPARDFLGAVFQRSPRPEVRARRRRREASQLPFDLYLALAARSQPLHRRGPIDPFSCFERRGVSATHDVEFLTRLDPGDRLAERYRPFGVVRLYRGGNPLPRLADATGFWATLREDLGLERVPDARDFLRAQPEDVPRGASPAYRYRLARSGSARVFARIGRRRVFTGEVLDALRTHLSPAQAVSWLEEAFAEPLRPGEIRHRYYLAADGRLLLVRHHWRKGKRLYRAETSAEAQRLCASSGPFRRLRAPLRRAA